MAWTYNHIDTSSPVWPSVANLVWVLFVFIRHRNTHMPFPQQHQLALIHLSRPKDSWFGFGVVCFLHQQPISLFCELLLHLRWRMEMFSVHANKRVSLATLFHTIHLSCHSTLWVKHLCVRISPFFCVLFFLVVVPSYTRRFPLSCSITVIRGSLVLAILNAKQMVFFWATFYRTVKVNFRKWTKIKRTYYIILVIHSIFPHGDWKLWSCRQKVQCPISKWDFLAFTFVSPSLANLPKQLYLNMFPYKATKYGNMASWVQYPLVYRPIKFLNVGLISKKHARNKFARFFF